MPPLSLEGDTLGKKHQHYNKLVENAIAGKHFELGKINADDSDIDNLLKIDIASKIRNVDYIIEVMQSKDMLYVSRAIKKSTWLITDEQYAHIINPEYLHTQLLPSMNTRAANKLMLHIRLHLKNETRVEAFYEHLKERDDAYKWLENCSIPFVENVVKNERCIPLSLYKRLCKRSVIFLPYFKRVEKTFDYLVFKEILVLLKSHTADVLNVLEQQDRDKLPVMGRKKTEFLMTICPQRILDQTKKYSNSIDWSVAAKYINKKEIQTFMFEQVKDNLIHYLSHYNDLKHFINNIPKEERFEFVKTIFIDKTNKEKHRLLNCQVESYQWYEFAPFDVAFTELKKLIRAENSPSTRCAMLLVLTTCARPNPEHIKTLLKFYKEKHINEPFKFKIMFVNNLLTQTSIHKFDADAWNVLDQLFHSLEVYIESENNVQMCLKNVILYKVLHDEEVPEIVKKKITFDTFKKFQRKLNQEQKDKMFSYLFNSVWSKIQNVTIASQADFSDIKEQLKNVLTLLIDWNRNINPLILEKVQELIKLRKENSWDTELSDLYNGKKSLRKHMFEESLALYLSEETCLNALKHKPQLLECYDKEMEMLRTNDAVSLRRLLAKLRVYWPHTLAQNWTEAYKKSLNKPTGQKAVIKGLFVLLPQKQLIDMARKHVPEDYKVNWSEIDQTEISIRKNIAIHLHVARPLIPLDTVLWYAKGDYLQYAVPSLNAIIHSLSKVESREHLSKLLDAPVALQKFGLHLAFNKLKSDELKPIFSRIWKTTKNYIIRSLLFMHTYTMICKAKNPVIEKELWELLSMFIDNLSADENKEIYTKLEKIEEVPLSILNEYYMKSYQYLTSLPEKANCEKHVKELLDYTPKIMVSLDEDFVADNILLPVETKFSKCNRKYIEIYSSYVLSGKTEEDQLRRFKRVIDPALDHIFELWDTVRDEEYYIRGNFNNFLTSLMFDFTSHITLNKMTTIPSKLFSEIKNKIEDKMPSLHGSNYVMYTTWKLATEYVKLVDEHKSMLSAFESQKIPEEEILHTWHMPSEIKSVWKELHFKISHSFGPFVVKCLKEDAEKYFPTISVLFAKAFQDMFPKFRFHDNKFILKSLKHMLNDNFIPAYIVVSIALPKYVENEFKKMQSEIREKIASHPSKEVQLHYQHAFRQTPEDNVNDKDKK